MFSLRLLSCLGNLRTNFGFSFFSFRVITNPYGTDQ